MNTIGTVAAFIGVLAAAIGYGTDVFEALVRGPRSPASTMRPSRPSWDASTSSATNACPSPGRSRSWRPPLRPSQLRSMARPPASLRPVSHLLPCSLGAPSTFVSRHRSTGSSSPPRRTHTTPDNTREPPSTLGQRHHGTRPADDNRRCRTCPHRHPPLMDRIDTSTRPAASGVSSARHQPAAIAGVIFVASWVAGLLIFAPSTDVRSSGAALLVAYRGHEFVPRCNSC